MATLSFWSVLLDILSFAMSAALFTLHAATAVAGIATVVVAVALVTWFRNPIRI